MRHEHLWEYGTFGRCIENNCRFVKPDSASDEIEKERRAAIKIPLWSAIVFFILMSIGVVVSVSWLLDQTDKIGILRVKSEIITGIKDGKGKFNLKDSNIEITPTGKNTARIILTNSHAVIAGASDEGNRQVWEGK